MLNIQLKVYKSERLIWNCNIFIVSAPSTFPVFWMRHNIADRKTILMQLHNHDCHCIISKSFSLLLMLLAQFYKIPTCSLLDPGSEFLEQYHAGQKGRQDTTQPQADGKVYLLPRRPKTCDMNSLWQWRFLKPENQNYTKSGFQTNKLTALVFVRHSGQFCY